MIAFMNIILLVITLNVQSYFCDLPNQENDKETLVLLHVLFRHGDRTPNANEIYPNDPYINYTYPPYGYGQLSDNGLKTEYLIGKALRKTYDHYFSKLALNDVVARTTDYNRTKLSCQMVLTGLYESKDAYIRENLYESLCYSVKKQADEILGDAANFCPTFKAMYEESTNHKGKELYNSHKDFYDYILNKTGHTLKLPVTASDLYYLFQAQEAFGLKLPDWTNDIWPDKLAVRGADQYIVYTGTPAMKRIGSGPLLEKILSDTQHRIESKSEQNTIKIFLYSAHDFNVAFLLLALNQFEPHVPPYGAYITLEVHNIDGVYGFRVFYQNYSTNNGTVPFKFKSCGSFCPIDKFKELVLDCLPVPEDCAI